MRFREAAQRLRLRCLALVKAARNKPTTSYQGGTKLKDMGQATVANYVEHDNFGGIGSGNEQEQGT